MTYEFVLQKLFVILCKYLLNENRAIQYLFDINNCHDYL